MKRLKESDSGEILPDIVKRYKPYHRPEASYNSINFMNRFEIMPVHHDRMT